jgi:hypothetical protein
VHNNKISLVISCRLYLIVRGGLRFVHDTQQVASPYFGNVVFRIAFFDQADSDVYQLVAGAASDQFAVSVEVRTDAYMVDSDQVDNVGDVADAFSASSLINPL